MPHRHNTARGLPAMSGSGVETDSAIYRLDYRGTLKQIDEQLLKRDIKTLSFLCRDIIPASKMENVHRGIDLFEELEAKMKLDPENLKFLAELLYRMQRMDLVKKLGFEVKAFGERLEIEDTQLTMYRLLLFELIENLTKSECQALKFIVQPHMTRMKKDATKDPMQLFNTLDMSQSLTEEDVDVLIKMFTAINRNDLIEKVHAYKGGIYKPKVYQMPVEFNINKQQAPAKNDNQQLVKNGHAINYDDMATGKTQQQTTGRPRISQSDNEKAAERILASPRPSCKTENIVVVPFSKEEPNSLSSAMLVNNNEILVPSAPNENYVTNIREAALQNNDENISVVTERMQNEGNLIELQPGPIPSLVEELTEQTNELSLTDEDKYNGLLSSYKMNRKPRGLCIIISNEQFFVIPDNKESKKLSNRNGTHVDHGNLQYIFNKLDFDVRLLENQISTDMVRQIMLFSSQDHSLYDCFACCILSHGEQGGVYGTDGIYVPIRELTKPFTGLSCPTLKGKPKLFFIQACQGKEKQPPVALERDAPNEDMETVPNEADFLLSYATLPGFVSYRSSRAGSWFITKLVEMLDRFADKLHILEILTKVNAEVAEATAKVNREGGVGHFKQSPAPLFTLRKRVIFK